MKIRQISLGVKQDKGKEKQAFSSESASVG